MSTDPYGDDALAIQRTALAWQRTGLAHMGTGALCLRLLPATPMRPALATVMIAVGVLITVGGRRLQPADRHHRPIVALSAVTTAVAVAAATLTFS